MAAKRKPLIASGDVVSIAFETNGKGYLGFIVEFPGAFVRGRTEQEALSKVDRESESYLMWLGVDSEASYRTAVVQRHHSLLMVEDADSEILLDADRGEISDSEFDNLVDLVWYSGETVLKIYSNAEFKNWVDEARIRSTFYGENCTTIEEILVHINRCQYYYLSRTGMEFEAREEDFMRIRGFCVEKIRDFYRKHNNQLVFDVDNELWTIKKILRRFIWHDRIHAKAMTRILEKQKQLGMISRYNDPFFFFSGLRWGHH